MKHKRKTFIFIKLPMWRGRDENYKTYKISKRYLDRFLQKKDDTLKRSNINELDLDHFLQLLEKDNKHTEIYDYVKTHYSMYFI